MTRNRFVGKHAVVLSLGMAGMVFLADLFTPLGVASGVPYSLAILLALHAPQRRYALAFAILCSVLTVSDLFIGPGRGGSELWKVLTNRSLALFMIWITLKLGAMRKQAEQSRRQAEAQSRSHLADLAHMNRVTTAGHLAAVLAHELNQPLAAISLQSEIANRRLGGDPDASPLVREALVEVASQSQRAADIIRSLRALVQKSESLRVEIPLNDLVDNVARLMSAYFERAAVRLQLRLSATTAHVLGDRIQLEQVLLNLLQNALDALDEVNERTRLIVVETCHDDQSITISVRDNGAGIEASEAERMFERFYSSKPQGMGLGLAISRSIIEAHGGRMWGESCMECGAKFSFSLPIVLKPARSARLHDTVLRATTHISMN